MEMNVDKDWKMYIHLPHSFSSFPLASRILLSRKYILPWEIRLLLFLETAHFRRKREETPIFFLSFLLHFLKHRLIFTNVLNILVFFFAYFPSLFIFFFLFKNQGNTKIKDKKTKRRKKQSELKQNTKSRVFRFKALESFYTWRLYFFTFYFLFLYSKRRGFPPLPSLLFTFYLFSFTLFFSFFLFLNVMDSYLYSYHKTSITILFIYLLFYFHSISNPRQEKMRIPVQLNK